ncbi:MAG: CHAT domain-containing protein [Calothrix sp. SM1_7_51]|nr:CHAT domain-containing protein [Calothrix sp. SM1_7_51]
MLSVEFPSSNGYSTLQFGKLESEVVSLFFDSRYRLQGNKASKIELENALSGGYNIFHFAGHAVDNLTHPENSELALAGDDRLPLASIRQKQLAAYKLVTLSFCQVTTSASNNIAQNISQNISSDYVGLVSSFLNQGVGHVLSTLWNVESAATTLVMIEFYQRIQQNQSPITALNEVTTWLKDLTALELTKWYEDLLNQLPPEGLRIRAHLAADLLRSSKIAPEQKVYSHPYYWSAFIVSGVGSRE